MIKYKRMRKGVLILQAFMMYLAIMIEKAHVLALLCNSDYRKMDLFFQIFPFSITTTILLIAIGILLLKCRPSCEKEDRLASLLFATFLLCGHCYANQGYFISIFLSGGILVLITGLVYIYGYYLIIRIVFTIIRLLAKYLCRIKTIQFLHFFNDHLYLIAFITMSTCWLPYILIRYPAGIEWDAYHQIEQFLGFERLSGHWPILSTIIMGVWVKAGKILFDSYNMGIFGFVLFQTCICICVLSYSLGFLKKIKIAPKWLLLILLNYSLVPTYPGFFTSVVKDSLFSIVVLLDIILAAEIILLSKKRKLILFTIISILICLLRKNGIYVIGAWLVGFILLIKKNRNYLHLIIACGIACLVSLLYSSILLPCMHIKQDNISMALSIPFQQTARYMKEYPDDITVEEKEIIDKVLDAKKIGELYNPLGSDSVCGTYHGTASDLPGYFKVWLRLLTRHPSVYFEAALNLCYGFFYPDAVDATDTSSGLYIGTFSDDVLVFEEPIFLKKYIPILVGYNQIWKQFPILSWLCNIGIQMWIALWMLLYSMKKRNSVSISLLIPTIIGILVCIASPTWWWNGFRYALPIICTNPLMLAIVMRDFRID